MITSVVMLLVACAGSRTQPATPPPDEEDTAAVADSTAETGVVDVPDTGLDTGASTDTAPPFVPTCGALPPTLCVRLTGNQDGDAAGRNVEVSDMDGDGLAELMVSESASLSADYSGVRSAVHVLRVPAASGYLADAAWLSVEGPPAATFPYWGEASTLIRGAGQVALSDFSDDVAVKVFDIPPAGGVFAPGDEVGGLRTAGYTEYGIPSTLSGCESSVGSPALCVTTIHSVNTPTGDNAGQLLVFDAPITTELVVPDARAQYRGDAGDSMRIADGDADLDGDGISDLVLGASYAQGVGRVAILLAPPDGLHRVWDVADATLTGDVPSGALGVGLGTGDLDDDGHVDVWAGASLAAPAGGCGFGGPHAGDRTVAVAEWSVVDIDGNRVGEALAVGDFDGDGAPDLAIGAPRGFLTGTEPGEVLIFLAPPPGTYTPADASVIHTSGSGQPDAFGISLDVGDVDGDGRDDLVVGAPSDPTAGDYAGSATLLYGGAL